MNIPIDSPYFQFLYWVINTPGIGSVIIWLVILSALAIYGMFLRQIHMARGKGEDSYPYPPMK
jgi:hypothetical protein